MDNVGKQQELISRQAAIDAPSVEPRKKGRWWKPTGMMHYECSVCRFWAMRDFLRYRVVFTNFCPNCGADMREEVSE